MVTTGLDYLTQRIAELERTIAVQVDRQALMHRQLEAVAGLLTPKQKQKLEDDGLWEPDNG